jgi:hypothetical protein
MRHLIFILLTVPLLFSCRAQKTVSNSKLNQETTIRNDISLTDDTRLKELTDQIFNRLISERLNIGIKYIKYDTEKPIDSITCKHPVSEETNININRETSVNETDSTHQETDSISAVKSKDNSQVDIKTKTELKEETKTGLNTIQKVLMSIGGFAIVGFIIFIIIKIKKQ